MQIVIQEIYGWRVIIWTNATNSTDVIFVLFRFSLPYFPPYMTYFFPGDAIKRHPDSQHPLMYFYISSQLNSQEHLANYNVRLVTCNALLDGTYGHLSLI
jgi:hypothetical protein